MSVNWEQFAENESNVKPESKTDWEKFADTEKSPSLKDMMISAFGKSVNPMNHFPLNIAKQAATTAPILAEDIGNMVSGGMKNVKEGFKPAIEQAQKEPARFGTNVLGGLAEAGRGLVNTPHDLPTYLAHLKIVDPKLAEQISSMMPQMPELESTLNNMIGQNPNAADMLIRKTFGLMPMGAPGIAQAGKAAPMIAREVKNIAKEVPEFIENIPKVISEQVIGKEPIKQADILARENEISEKTAQHEALQTESMDQKELHRQAVSEAEKNLNMANANRMEYKLSEQTKKIDDLRNESDRLQNDIKQLPELPEKPVAGEEHIEKVKATEEGINRLKQNLVNAENHHSEIEKIANESETDLGKYLDTGASHDVRAARIVKGKLEANREEIGSEYDQIKSDLKNENVVIDNTHKVKELTTDLHKLLQESGGLEKNAAEIEKVGKELLAAKNKDIIPASDFVSMYKSINDYMREAYRKAYKIGRSEDEHVLWKKRGEEAATKLKEMDSILEQNLPEEVYNRLKKTPARWRNEIIPLYKEPLYWQILEQERLPKDMLSALRGGKKGSGLEIIRNKIMSDPQAVKHVIGQRYDISPESVHQPNELMREFMALDPHVTRLADLRNEAHGLMENAKRQIKDIKKRHGEAKAELPTVRKESTLRQKEIDRQLKEHERLTNERIKTKEDLQAKIQEHESEIQALHEHNAILKKHMSELKESFNKTNITLKEKHRLGMEIKRLKRELEQNRKKEFSTTTGLRKLYKIGKNIYRFGKKIAIGGF